MEGYRRYRLKYEFYPNHYGYQNHIWQLIGPRGAVHVSIIDYGTDGEGLGVADSKGRTASGGIETHWNEWHRSRDRAPDHIGCKLTGRPCWHSGSSSFVSEEIIPHLDLGSLRMSHHRMVFEKCRRWYEENIDGEAS